MDSVSSAGNKSAEPAGFVALSRFVVANGMEAAVKAAFRTRPHCVDHTAGFIRMEVLCPCDRPQEAARPVSVNSKSSAIDGW